VILPQTSPLPSDSLPYPLPTQDPVAPPKRVLVGRTVARRLRLRYCLTTASKNQVQTISGCRQGGDFTTNLATALLTLSRTRLLPKISLLKPKQVVVGRTASQQLRLRLFLYTCKQESDLTQLGVPTRGRFYNKPRHCPRTLSPTRRHPRPRCSTITSRRRPHSSATAPSSSVPYIGKKESGATQLGLPIRGRFHLKPRNCLLSLSPSRRPAKTP